MWSSRVEILEKDKTIQYQILYKNKVISFYEFLKFCQGSDSFIIFFTNLLAEAPWQAYFWEMPPLRDNYLDQDLAFVLIRSSRLAHIEADPSDFHAYFSDSQQLTASFMNLGGDARLLAPLPQGPEENYSHLARFIKYAPEQQQIDLFRQLGETVEQNLSERPLWINTSGLGVPWLHIRLDSRPKYYQHQPYTTI